ncbi:MAG TPA: HTH domain-containing protein [Conexibacter sp.]|nr:HTH domain-containing protein [Conexibacter sp.]
MASQFLHVAEALFERERRPMSARELVDLALRDGLLETGGSTPWQTMKAKLSVEIRKNGEQSTFVRVGPGSFFLRGLTDERQIFNARPLAPPASRERVFVFPSDKLDRATRFQGITRAWGPYIDSLLGHSGLYMDRIAAEQNDDHKQVLTYIMVTRGTKILCYKRGTYNRVEDSLRGLLCVGFGGHTLADDHDLTSVDDFGARRSAARELGEEISLPPMDAQRLERLEGLRIIGALNDDSSAVGRRHFAVLCQYEVTDDEGWGDVQRGEKSITQLRWLDLQSDEIPLEKFEYWSQLVLREFYPRLVRGRATYLIRRARPLRPPHILCVLGPIGSGKTATTQHLRNDFGYTEVNSGQVVASLLGRPHLTPKNEDERPAFQSAALEFIESADGPRRLASAIWSRAQEAGSGRVLVDGVRQRRTLEALVSSAQDWAVGVLYVYTPADIAFDFYRRRRGPSTNIHEFVAVRDASVEREVANLIVDAECGHLQLDWPDGAARCRAGAHEGPRSYALGTLCAVALLRRPSDLVFALGVGETPPRPSPPRARSARSRRSAGWW